MHRIFFYAAAIALLLLNSCSVFGESDVGPHSRGLVVGDEPYAVQAGAAVLADGGSAADAATAIYFALSVTYSVAAGIGGGGICTVRDAGPAQVEVFDFLARDAAGGGLYAVPGTVAGFAAIQSAYGKLPWQRTVAPAEGFAAAGFPISHALAARLGASQDVIRLDAGLAAEFLDESGHVKPAGAMVQNPDLAQTLSTIRTLGPLGFYRGQIADKIVSYSSAQGGEFNTREFAAYAPGHGDAVQVALGGAIAYIPPRRLGAGAFVASLLSQFADVNGNATAEENLATAVAVATRKTLDGFKIASLPRDLGATGFATRDSNGQAVACAVTMNGPFGSGHTAAGTGVTLAPAPSSSVAGLAAAFLTPVVAASGDELSLVGAGAGGPNGAAAILYALLKLSRGMDVMTPGALHSTGIAPYDTANVIACQRGTCAAVPDPGGQGLGAAGN